MSLINEALKRAQHERSANPADMPPMPGGSSRGRGGSSMPGQSLVLILGGGAAAVVLAVVLTVYFVNRQPAPKVTAPAATAPVVSAPVATTPPAEMPAVVRPAPVKVAAVREAPKPVPEPSPVVVAPVVQVPRAIDLARERQLAAEAAAKAEAAAQAEAAARLAEENARAEAAAKAASAALAAEAAAPTANPAGKSLTGTEAGPATRVAAKPHVTVAAGEQDIEIMKFVAAIRVTGIRSSGSDSKVLMNDKVYRVNDVVNFDLMVRLIKVEADGLTFADANGTAYVKNF